MHLRWLQLAGRVLTMAMVLGHAVEVSQGALVTEVFSGRADDTGGAYVEITTEDKQTIDLVVLDASARATRAVRSVTTIQPSTARRRAHVIHEPHAPVTVPQPESTMEVEDLGLGSGPGGRHVIVFDGPTGWQRGQAQTPAQWGTDPMVPSIADVVTLQYADGVWSAPALGNESVIAIQPGEALSRALDNNEERFTDTFAAGPIDENLVFVDHGIELNPGWINEHGLAPEPQTGAMLLAAMGTILLRRRSHIRCA